MREFYNACICENKSTKKLLKKFINIKNFATIQYALN